MAFRKQTPDGWPEVFAEFSIKKRDGLEKKAVVDWCEELDYIINEDGKYYYCGRYENIMTMTSSGQDMTDACVLFFEKFLSDLKKAKGDWRVLCGIDE